MEFVESAKQLAVRGLLTVYKWALFFAIQYPDVASILAVVIVLYLLYSIAKMIFRYLYSTVIMLVKITFVVAVGVSIFLCYTGGFSSFIEEVSELIEMLGLLIGGSVEDPGKDNFFDNLDFDFDSVNGDSFKVDAGDLKSGFTFFDLLKSLKVEHFSEAASLLKFCMSRFTEQVQYSAKQLVTSEALKKHYESLQ